jgi:hypothetical protein
VSEAAYGTKSFIRQPLCTTDELPLIVKKQKFVVRSRINLISFIFLNLILI